jgi:hypothetical protein
MWLLLSHQGSIVDWDRHQQSDSFVHSCSTSGRLEFVPYSGCLGLGLIVDAGQGIDWQNDQPVHNSNMTWLL